MACTDDVMIVERATSDHEARVTPADAFAEDHGASEVQISKAGDQSCSGESSNAVIADSAVAEPLRQSTTSASSGLTGGRKCTLAQLVAEDSIAEDEAFSEKPFPPTEIIDIPTAETQGTIYSEAVDGGDLAAVAEPCGQRMKSCKKGDGKSTTLAEHFKDEMNNANRDLSGESSPGTGTSVILFGRTGSGKSTLAQMLTLGKLDARCPDFFPSSGIRGQTRELKNGDGRHWRVVDTPGFLEPKDSKRTISSQEAEKKIRKYIQMIEGTYTHFLYMVMKDRIDELDKKLWKFFRQLFGDRIKTNFSVVISNASVGWLQENRAELAASFKGCASFLSAEFPPIRSDDEEWEKELEAIRTDSLAKLEMELAKLGRGPVECHILRGILCTTGDSLKQLWTNVTSHFSFSGAIRSVLQITGLMDNGHHILEPDIPSAIDKASPS